MIDREKVIRGLECCKSSACPLDCPYLPVNKCISLLCDDAIALLREQEGYRWISVKERLPENQDTVLAIKQTKGGVRSICLAYCIKEYAYFDPITKDKIVGPYWVCGGNNNIIWWRPLPAMPEEVI